MALETRVDPPFMSEWSRGITVVSCDLGHSPGQQRHTEVTPMAHWNDQRQAPILANAFALTLLEFVDCVRGSGGETRCWVSSIAGSVWTACYAVW